MFLTRRPSPSLAAHVAFLWYADFGAVTADRVERVLPDGAMQLVVNLRDQPMRVFDRHRPSTHVALPSAILTGPTAEFNIISAADTASTVGVSFRPGGAAAFLGMPPAELFDRDLDLATAWGQCFADEVRNRTLECESAAARLDGLDALLLRQWRGLDVTHRAVDWAVRALSQRTAPPVADIVGRVGMSHRRFIELFHAAVGLTPKRFSRLQRFQDLLRSAHATHEQGWADLAAACGYSDQAHLTHDFRAFSGLTPSDYLRRRTPFTNHVIETQR